MQLPLGLQFTLHKWLLSLSNTAVIFIDRLCGHDSHSNVCFQQKSHNHPYIDQEVRYAARSLSAVRAMEALTHRGSRSRSDGPSREARTSHGQVDNG